MSVNWNEQAQQMMKSWSEAQMKLWENWSQTAPEGPAAAAPGAEWFSQWHEMARKNLNALSGGAEGAPRELVERLFAGEQTYLRFVDLCLQGFKAMAPGIQAGEDWVELLKRYIAQMKDDLGTGKAPWMTPAGAAAIAKDVPELWRLYTAEVQKLVVPWLDSVREARGHLGEAASGDRHAAIKMLNVFMDTFESTLGKFTAAPAIGYTREFQEKLTKAFETWVDVRRAEVEFQTEILNTGFRSLEHLVRRLVELGEKGQKLTSFRQLFDLWIETSEKVFFEVASTDAFAEMQARLVNAAMHYRLHERELAEEFLKALHLPTRAELDDAYKHLAVMRREVKVLRKELEELKGRVAALAAVPAAAAPAPLKAPPKVPQKAPQKVPQKVPAASPSRARTARSPKASTATKKKEG